MVMLVAMGGGALLSFCFETKGGAAEISRVGATNGEVDELPCFPCL